MDRWTPLVANCDDEISCKWVAETECVCLQEGCPYRGSGCNAPEDDPDWYDPF